VGIVMGMGDGGAHAGNGAIVRPAKNPKGKTTVKSPLEEKTYWATWRRALLLWRELSYGGLVLINKLQNLNLPNMGIGLSGRCF